MVKDDVLVSLTLSKGIVPAKLREALRDARTMQVVCKIFFYAYNFMKYICMIANSLFPPHRSKNGDCQFELEKREFAKIANAQGRLPY